MSTATLDTTIALVRITIHNRRKLVDGLRDRATNDALRAIAEAFEEDVAVLERARDALVEQRNAARAEHNAG